MAEVVLKDLKKIYPSQDGKRRKHQKGASGEKTTNLQITDEGVVAVQQFNIEIKDKEFIVLVGPSGCGKSTTLRMIAGLEDISCGELYIDGKLMNDVPPKDRDIAMVFQSYALYPHMTVYDNMAFSLRMRKVPDEGKEGRTRKLTEMEINEKVMQAAEILGITEYLSRKPKALSGGQRQRVAIGRAIVRSPKVFLMDEPLSNLDAKLRNQMRAELIKLRERVDGTFVYVTHDQTEAMTLGDRIVIMKDGFIQQIGTPQEVFDHPTNLFVAGFIGVPQMNFFDAELKRRDGVCVVAVAKMDIAVPADMAEELRAVPTGPVTLGIRPEHISLCDADAPNAITGRVDVSEMMGSSVHVHATVDGKDVVMVLRTLDIAEEFHGSFKSGMDISFTFNFSSVHLFDRQTGKALIGNRILEPSKSGPIGKS